MRMAMAAALVVALALPASAHHSFSAEFIGRSLRGPVVDGTGLEGVFDFNVEFASDTFSTSLKAGERDASLGLPSALVPPNPDLADALKSELGLVFETQRRPIEVLVRYRLPALRKLTSAAVRVKRSVKRSSSRYTVALHACSCPSWRGR